MGSLRRPLSVHTSNDFSSETNGANVTKFHMLHPGPGGTKISENGFDPKFKMAAMPIYGKNHSKIFFSRTTRRIRLIFCRKHMGHLAV